MCQGLDPHTDLLHFVLSHCPIFTSAIISVNSAFYVDFPEKTDSRLKAALRAALGNREMSRETGNE